MDDVLTLQVQSPAAGGACVARHEGRVVFVRYALPGETVRAEVIHGGPNSRLWWAQVTEVLEPSPHRRQPPCADAVPGRCGGCDWQHADPVALRKIQAEVLRDQFRRIGHLDLDQLGLPDLTVQPLPSEFADSGVRWRLRVRMVADSTGRLGYYRYRSDYVQSVQDCSVAHPAITELRLTERTWGPGGVVEVAVSADGAQRVVLVDGVLDRVLSTGHGIKHELQIAGCTREFLVRGGGFWQAHQGAAQTYVDAIRTAVAAQPGQHVADLYSGVGVFAAALAADVGPTGTVLAVESDADAIRAARRNLHDLPHVSLEMADVAQVVAQLKDAAPAPAWDVVVLDPPRRGAGVQVVADLADMRPATIAYLSCDAASLARDLRVLLDAGYQLSHLQVWDAFPGTAHVELLAVVRAVQ